MGEAFHTSYHEQKSSMFLCLLMSEYGVRQLIGEK